MKRLLLVLVVFLCFSNSAWADKFYCAVFSHDSRPVPLPQYSHVWGTFVRTDDNGNLKQEITISWAPKDKWHWTDRPKNGYNMTLRESFEAAENGNRSMCVWGPVEVTEELYQRAESCSCAGGYYKGFDAISRRWCDPSAMNCIHRLSDVAGGSRLVTHFRFGKSAGHAVFSHFQKRGFFLPTLPQDRDRVAKILNLDYYILQRMK